MWPWLSTDQCVGKCDPGFPQTSVLVSVTLAFHRPVCWCRGPSGGRLSTQAKTEVQSCVENLSPKSRTANANTIHTQTKQNEYNKKHEEIPGNNLLKMSWKIHSSKKQSHTPILTNLSSSETKCWLKKCVRKTQFWLHGNVLLPTTNNVTANSS